jgi:hypothetical protein
MTIDPSKLQNLKRHFCPTDHDDIATYSLGLIHTALESPSPLAPKRPRFIHSYGKGAFKATRRTYSFDHRSVDC